MEYFPGLNETINTHYEDVQYTPVDRRKNHIKVIHSEVLKTSNKEKNVKANGK